MSINLQAYNKGKRVFYRSNLLWEEAFEYLEIRRNKEIDKLDLQLFTDDGKNGMPLEDIEDLKAIKEGQNWINYVMGKVIKRQYKGVRYD